MQRFGIILSISIQYATDTHLNVLFLFFSALALLPQALMKFRPTRPGGQQTANTNEGIEANQPTSGHNE